MHIKLSAYKATFTYILLIPVINIILAYAPVYRITTDIHYTPASMLVGMVYMARDFTQRELGHRWVFVPMLAAAVITYLLGSPAMALASLTAFACGEVTEWGIFTFTRKPFSQRVLLSCALALPVDIVIVLVGLHFAAPGLIPVNLSNMVLMYTNNMLSVVLAFFILRFMETKNRQNNLEDTPRII